MAESMTDERIAKIKAHLAFADEDGRTMGDIYARDLLAENEELRTKLRQAEAKAADLQERFDEDRMAAMEYPR